MKYKIERGRPKNTEGRLIKEIRVYDFLIHFESNMIELIIMLSILWRRAVKLTPSLLQR